VLPGESAKPNSNHFPDGTYVLSDEHVRNQLASLKSAGEPLSHDFSIFRIRIANAAERQLYKDNAASLLTSDGQELVLLVTLDDPF
jgi:hypothetical protein